MNFRDWYRWSAPMAFWLVAAVSGCATHNDVTSTAAEPECAVDAYAANQPKSDVSGLPSDWDPSIPIPSGASISGSPQTHGSVETVEFSAPGHSHQELVDFYTNGLTRAGYSLGNSVAGAGGKTFNVSFSACGRLDSVTIESESPASQIRIAYEPRQTGKHASSPTDQIVNLYAQCSFGDSDACQKVNAMNAQPGGVTTGVEHDAIIQEQLKSPEQRQRDYSRTRGMWGAPQD